MGERNAVTWAMELVTPILTAITYHSKHPKEPLKAARKWDGKTPFAVHPLWAGLTILHETLLPEDIRYEGSVALFFHDIPEDTTKELPVVTSNKVREWVKGLTFGSTEEKHREVWKRGKEIMLLEAYDAVASLQDISGLSEEKQRKSKEFATALLIQVERDWGKLNIVKIGRALCT